MRDREFKCQPFDKLRVKSVRINQKCLILKASNTKAERPEVAAHAGTAAVKAQVAGVRTTNRT